MNPYHPLTGISLALALSLGSTAIAADGPFAAPAAFTGSVEFSGTDGAPIYAGNTVEVSGEGFQPGQIVTLHRGDALLSADGLKADDKGAFTFAFDLPGDAALGLHPVVVQTAGPDSAEIVAMKVSPNLPLAGADQFDSQRAKVAAGVYQVAISEKNGALFTASSSGRPPVKDSKIQKLDPASLQVLAETIPAEAPGGGVFAAYGIGVDDANGNVWVTNTRQNSVTVYAQDDLSLIKQFELGAVEKPRDVVIDQNRNRAYVSTHRTGVIEVFDTAKLEKLPPLEVKSEVRGGQFATMTLALDATGHKLYTVSLRTPEAARIDLTSGEVKVYALPGAEAATGLDIDPATGRIYVASQRSDDLIALDGETGEVIFDKPVGATPLNVAFDKATGQVFVANRGSDTITVLDAATGEVLANLDGGSLPNHLKVATDGTVFAVNKARGKDDPEGDHIMRITPKS